MVTQARWKRAQEYEAGFWEGVAEEAEAGSYQKIGFYEWRAQEFAKRLEGIGLISILDGSRRIVELGSGPVGIVGFLPAIEKVAVDPLNGAYAKNVKLTELRKGDVRYLEAPGESVPLDSGRFDLVIMENCIDHVHDVDAVMSEIRRLLSDDGVLYLTVNARARPGFWIHRLLARLALDPGHPHTFTTHRFHDMLRRNGFDPVQLEAGSWRKAWLADLRSGERRGRLKGALLVSEYLLTAIARKTEIPRT